MPKVIQKAMLKRNRDRDLTLVDAASVEVGELVMCIEIGEKASNGYPRFSSAQESCINDAAAKVASNCATCQSLGAVQCSHVSVTHCGHPSCLL